MASVIVADIEAGVFSLRKRASARQTLVGLSIISLGMISILGFWCAYLHTGDVEILRASNISHSIVERFAPTDYGTIRVVPDLPAKSNPDSQQNVSPISDHIEENQPEFQYPNKESRDDCNPLSPLCRRGWFKSTPMAHPDITGNTNCGAWDKFKDFFHFGEPPDCHDKDPVCNWVDKLEGKIHLGDPKCITQKDWDHGSHSKRGLEYEHIRITHGGREAWLDKEWVERYKLYHQEMADAKPEQEEQEEELNLAPRGFWDFLLDNGDRPPKVGKEIDRVDENGNIQIYEGGPIYDGDCSIMFIDSAASGCVIDPGSSGEEPSSEDVSEDGY